MAIFTLTNNATDFVDHFFVYRETQRTFVEVSYQQLCSYLTERGVEISHVNELRDTGSGEWKTLDMSAKLTVLFNRFNVIPDTTGEEPELFVGLDSYAHVFLSESVRHLVQTESFSTNPDATSYMVRHVTPITSQELVERVMEAGGEKPENSRFLQHVLKSVHTSVVSWFFRTFMQDVVGPLRRNGFIESAAANPGLSEETEDVVWSFATNSHGTQNAWAMQQIVARTSDINKVSEFVKDASIQDIDFEVIIQRHHDSKDVRDALMGHRIKGVREIAVRMYVLSDEEASQLLASDEAEQMMLASNLHLRSLDETLLSDLAFHPNDKVRRRFLSNPFIPETLKDILGVAS